MLASFAFDTASFAIVTAPLLANVTSPLTATELISFPSPTSILPSSLTSNAAGSPLASPTIILPLVIPANFANETALSAIVKRPPAATSISEDSEFILEKIWSSKLLKVIFFSSLEASASATTTKSA